MRRSLATPLLALALLVAPAVGAAQQPAGAGAAVSGSATTVSAGDAGARALPTGSRVAVRRAAPAASVAASTRTARTAAPKAAPKPRPKTPARPAAGPARKAAPAPTGAYAFLHVDSGAPVRWNPCATVPWTFNPAGAPAGGLAAVQAAFAEISDRTGISFDYQGTVTTVPSGSYLSQSWKQFKPLLVGWSSAGRTDLLSGRGDSTVGVTRVLWTGSYDDGGVNHTQIASGAVAFNTAVKARTTGAGSWFTYALHELGHAVGLAHVDDDTQIMNPVISGSVAHYGVGDANGLRRLGSTAGCLPTIR